MKLKLFIFALFALLSLVAYKTYKDTTTLKYIDSYDSCIADKASTIQESYPQTCVSRFGTHFINPSIVPENIPGSNQILHSTDQRVTSYTSELAKLSFTFPRPLYVLDTYQVGNDRLGSGGIIISDELIDNNYPPSLSINYGIPFIDGKGGACVDENGEGNWKDMTIWGQQLSVCEDDHYLSGGYPKHPNGNIEYSLGVDGQEITQEDATMYKNILFTAKFTD